MQVEKSTVHLVCTRTCGLDILLLYPGSGSLVGPDVDALHVVNARIEGGQLYGTLQVARFD